MITYTHIYTYVHIVLHVVFYHFKTLSAQLWIWSLKQDRCHPDFEDRELQAWRAACLPIPLPGPMTAPAGIQAELSTCTTRGMHPTRQRQTCSFFQKTHRKVHPISAMERSSLKNMALKTLKKNQTHRHRPPYGDYQRKGVGGGRRR